MIDAATAVSFNATAANEIRVAFLGNSIQYFNDCPRLVENMLRTKFGIDGVYQDSCLRGGSSLPTLWTDGNGMLETFGQSEHAKRDDGSFDIGAETVAALLGVNDYEVSVQIAGGVTPHWDYVVLNDYTQAPARPETRAVTLQALDQHYGPLLTSTIPILLQTAAYRENEKGSDDLGSVVDFTSRVKEGYYEYAKVLKKYANDVRVAPVGDAYLWVYLRNTELWRTLFNTDNFHPSPHGTWLQACVLYCTMLREAPPVFQSDFFARARFMQSLDEESLPLPSMEEAEELRMVACSVCGVGLTSGVE